MTTHTPSDLRRFEPVFDAILLAAAIDHAQRHDPCLPRRRRISVHEVAK